MDASFSRAHRARRFSHRQRNVRRCRVERLESRQLLAGLVQEGDLQYQGAFNVPQGQIGDSTFEYGGTALAYDDVNNSLFMVGHDWDQAVAEVSIPELRTGDLGELATAEVRQSFTPLLNRVPEQTLDGGEGVKIGGLLVDGGRMIGTAYEYYDADQNAVDSHFTLSSTDLDESEVGGLYQVGTQGGGFVGGYMAEVPSEWQTMLGARHVTGQAALSIIGRTSAGPALFGFDPNQLSSEVTPAAPLVEYPLDHPLAPETTQNPLFNTTTEIRGVVFPEGTDSVLFIGSHGTGAYWYGEASEGEFHDPYRPDKGPHAPEYVYQVWAYDVHDLIAVRQGTKQPWEIQPYAVWDLDLPYPEGGKHIGGVAYDSATGTLYVSQQYGNEAYPVIHAFHVGQTVENVPTNQPPTDIVLSPSEVMIPENTTIPVDLKLADITVMDDGLGSNTLTLSGEDQTYFTIIGNALYLRAGTKLDYEAKWSYGLGLEAHDASLSSPPVSARFQLLITDGNDAPILNNALNPSLGTITEDTADPAGMFIYSMLVNAVTDVDRDALRGIAVTATTNNANGSWQYKLSGSTTWVGMTPPSSSQALLLPETALVRFVPKANFFGEVKLWYRAWDQTEGTIGGTIDTTGNQGGGHSLSVALENAVLAVLPVNDNPVLTLSGSLGYKRNDPAVALAPNATVTDPDSANFDGGVLRVRIASGYSSNDTLAIGNGFTVDSLGRVLQGTTIIGTRMIYGNDANELVVMFNSNATKSVVQALVRSITYSNFNGVSGQRKIEFTLSDGDGGLSDVRTRTVNVK
jgi:hypothetical protein